MKEFFSSIKFKVFAVIALLLIGLMIRTAMNGGMSTITASGLSLVVSPFQKLSSSISNFFNGMVNDITSFSSLKSENAKLKKKIDSLQSQLVNYNDVLRENQQLEAAYDLHKNNPDFKLKPAGVISRESGQWFSTFTIDKGSLDGIGKLDAVLTSDSDLVGKITEVSAHSAVVTTFLDPSVPVGILISETGDAGQTEGQLVLRSKGEFKIGYLPKESAVSPGDIVVTSGRGGVFPKNLKVGTVTSVGTDATGMSLSAVCKPIVSMSNLKNVFVLTDFNGKDVSSASSTGGK